MSRISSAGLVPQFREFNIYLISGQRFRINQYACCLLFIVGWTSFNCNVPMKIQLTDFISRDFVPCVVKYLAGSLGNSLNTAEKDKVRNALLWAV